MKITPDMMVYKNRKEKKPVFEIAASFEKNGVYETNLTMNLHTGTHIDFPKHTLENGHTSIDFDLSKLLRAVKVFDMTSVLDSIKKEDIDSLSIGENDFILFKTRNSFDETFNFDFVYLAEDAAKYLAKKNISGVGIDALGIERNQEGHPTHDILLKKGIIILEGLNLKEVEHDIYDMICLPMYIDDVEALPVRVVLKSK
jgi:arylformamidase